LPAGIRAHTFDDGYYHARTADLSQVTVPLLSAANWAGFGLHARGNFSGYSRAASAQKWLEVHGGRHEAWFYLPAGLELQHRSSAHFLRGLANAGPSEPPVRLHIRRPGEHFELRRETEWPLARTRWTELHLDAAAARLVQKPPAAQTTITFDALGPGVTFRTVLEAETEITGPLAATLTVSTSTTDADIFAPVHAILAVGPATNYPGP